MDFEKIRAFLRSMKWRFYFTTIQIFAGYLLVAWPNIGLRDLYKIISLFIIFGPLLHGGIYTLNDIFDLEEDKRHPTKRKRPLASGQISVKEAYIFSITLIVAAFVFSYSINFYLVVMCSLFLIVNLLYSFIFKKIPYLEIIINTITHPLRFYSGVIAAGSFGFHGIAFLIGLFALSIAILKRKKELIEMSEIAIRNLRASTQSKKAISEHAQEHNVLDNQEKSRKVLKYYTNNSLRNLIIVVGFIILVKLLISKNLDFWFGIIIFTLYIILMVGYHKTRSIRKLMNNWY